MHLLTHSRGRAVALTAVVGLAAAGCASHASPSDSPVTSTAVAPTSSTTTTPALPSALQPTAPQAASALIDDWARGDAAAAQSVATRSSVNALFAAHYVAGLAIARGCSTAFPPIKCTYGPPGGAPPSDPIYELSVSMAPGGWYVSEVQIEG